MTQYDQYCSEDVIKGLFILSKWNDTPYVLTKFSLDQSLVRLPRSDENGLQFLTLSGSKEYELPCYDTTYLLRKLPKTIIMNQKPYFLFLTPCESAEDSKFSANYTSHILENTGKYDSKMLLEAIGDTPDDALGKLANLLYLKDYLK